MSSDKIPHARLSKTTRFSDAVFQQEQQLSGVPSISGVHSGLNIDPAAPEKLWKLSPPSSSISLLLVLAGVIIGFQVSHQSISPWQHVAAGCMTEHKERLMPCSSSV